MAKGVRQHSSGGWTATIWYNGKSNHVGIYRTEAEAVYHVNKRRQELKDKGVVLNEYNKNHYVDPISLRNEMLISLTQGKLTNKLTKDMMLIAKRTHLRMRYNDPDDKHDCYIYGLQAMLSNWYNFDIDRYDSVLPYLTEIFKRGIAHHWNKIQKHSKHLSIEATYESGALNI